MGMITGPLGASGAILGPLGAPSGGHVPQSRYSLSFDGSTGAVPGSATNTLPIGYSARTIAAWVKHSPTDVNYTFILDYGKASGATFGTHCLFHIMANPSYAAGLSPGWPTLECYGLTIGGNVAVNDGEWHHVAIAIQPNQAGNTNTVNFYVDGEACTTILSTGATDAAINTPASAFAIGADALDGLFGSGNIDFLAVYAGILTSTQIGQLAAGSVDPDSFGPVAFWPFEEGPGSGTTADASGNGNTGTLTGGVTWSTDVPTQLQ